MSYLCRCEECRRDFTQKIHLRKHLEKHHPDIHYDFDVKDSAGNLIKVEDLGDEAKIIFEEEYEIVEEDEESADK